MYFFGDIHFMRMFTVTLLLLLLLPIYSAECAEFELYKEILGHQLDSSTQSLAVDNKGNLWVCSGGLVFRYNGEIWEDFTEISGGASMVSASYDGVVWFTDDGFWRAASSTVCILHSGANPYVRRRGKGDVRQRTGTITGRNSVMGLHMAHLSGCSAGSR